MNLCVDFGGTTVKVGVADGDRVLETRGFEVGGTASDLDRVVGTARALGIGDQVGGIAIAVPGLVDAAGRRLVEAHGKYDWLLGVDLAEWARDALGASVHVENDARAALIGETSTGCAAGESDAIILVLGTGIGTAALVDGRPLRGPDGSAAILSGHVTVDWDGPRCNCGNVGCAEVYGGSWALADRIRDLAGDEPTNLDPSAGYAGIVAATRAGDPLARRVLDQAIRAWSACAVSMCHAFDPRVVVLAGGVARAADLVAPALQSYLDDHLWSSIPRPSLRVSTDPEWSVLRGLAVLAQEAAE